MEVFKSGKVNVIASGLNDPKGLIVVENIIYVTDVDEIKKVTLSGKVTTWLGPKNFPKKTAFLNDIAIGPNNIIFISDSGNKVDGMRKGGAVIFDESGIHRGSKTSLTDRIALRFFYKKKTYGN